MILKYLNITRDLSLTANIYLAILYHYRKRKTLNIIICRCLGISEQTGIKIRNELKEKQYISISKQQHKDINNKYVSKTQISFLCKALDLYEKEIKSFDKTNDLPAREKTDLEKLFLEVYQKIKRKGERNE